MNKNNPWLRPLLAALATLTLAASVAAPRAAAFGWPNDNDNMFPSAKSARNVISFDGRGFLIHGKRTFVVAGEMHYSRIPRAQWRTRLLRIKRAGYNAVQTYAFWNYHEPREGQFDFTGDHDFNAYLQLIHSLGMYAIVRMGPYVNAEWDTGGLPVWLRFKPGLHPMSDNGPFWAAVNPYLNRLIPIIAANQITHGGAVIMVQLENEHVLPGGAGGGTDIVNSYYQKFLNRVIRGGIVVPHFFSGLNHNDDPAGDEPFDTSQRPSPWYSTEFWTGWVGRYGVDTDRERKLERTTWKVIAYGGGGYTHYMMSGGSDFDTWNNDEQAASYDFGAPIGQAGDLRDDYYWVKRAAMFATSFADVTANSIASNGGGAVSPTSGGIRITQRKGPAGSIIFLDNSSGGPTQTQVRSAGKTYPHAGPITLDPGEIMPVVKGYPLLPGVNIEIAAARLLGVTTQGATTTLVTYGHPGERAEIHFRVPASGVRVLQVPARPGASLTRTNGEIVLTAAYPKSGPDVFTFRVGGQTVRVLAESEDMANRTWFVPVSGKMEIVCGPAYVGEAEEQAGRLILDTERPWQGGPASGAALVFGPDRALPLTPIAVPGARPAAATPPALGPWTTDTTVPQAQPKFADTGWLHTEQPKAMGADGDYSAYAWYRTTVTAPSAGTYKLSLSDAGDWLTCFVNGQRQDSSDVETRYKSPIARQMTVKLNAGANSLAILTAHYGRNKLFNYYGPLDEIDAKGISGPVTLTQQSAQNTDINAFRWKADDNGPTDADTLAGPGQATTSADWHDADTSTDVFQGRVGYAWFRATLPNAAGPHRLLHFNSIDDSGTVYLNGKLLASDVGVNANQDVPLDSAWHENGPNVLAVLVQNTAGAGGLLGKITLVGNLGGGQEIHGWRMRGGESSPPANSPDWRPLSVGTTPGVPAWYRTTFTVTPPSPIGPHPILRLAFAPLSRGFVYLNGHNLGRYPEKSPVDGIYLQECWLHPGKNTLTVFDEDGNSPSQVKIFVETAASRRGTVLATRPKTLERRASR